MAQETEILNIDTPVEADAEDDETVVVQPSDPSVEGPDIVAESDDEDENEDDEDEQGDDEGVLEGEDVA